MREIAQKIANIFAPFEESEYIRLAECAGKKEIIDRLFDFLSSLPSEKRSGCPKLKDLAFIRERLEEYLENKKTSDETLQFLRSLPAEQREGCPKLEDLDFIDKNYYSRFAEDKEKNHIAGELYGFLKMCGKEDEKYEYLFRNEYSQFAEFPQAKEIINKLFSFLNSLDEEERDKCPKLEDIDFLKSNYYSRFANHLQKEKIASELFSFLKTVDKRAEIPNLAELLFLCDNYYAKGVIDYFEIIGSIENISETGFELVLLEDGSRQCLTISNASKEIENLRSGIVQNARIISGDAINYFEVKRNVFEEMLKLLDPYFKYFLDIEDLIEIGEIDVILYQANEIDDELAMKLLKLTFYKTEYYTDNISYAQYGTFFHKALLHPCFKIEDLEVILDNYRCKGEYSYNDEYFLLRNEKGQTIGDLPLPALLRR